MDLIKAMGNLQEGKKLESQKLANLIKKQNIKKENKNLKEELEGTDPAALNDDIELLEKVNAILNEIWDIKVGGDSEFFNLVEDQLSTVCDSVSEMLKKAREIFEREENEMLSSEEDETDLDDLEN